MTNLINILYRIGYQLFIFSVLSLLFFSSCFDSHKATHSKWISLTGRNQGQPIYRLQIPSEWQFIAPPPEESLLDTTKAIGTVTHSENGQSLIITIHNFPFEKIAHRIPSSAQTARWERQFDTLDLEGTHTQPQAFSGYVGIRFEGSGTRHGQPVAVLAWAMQIAPLHLNVLMYPSNEEEKAEFPQMRADMTIKAMGPPALIEKYREEIIDMARSFELIKPIPQQP